MLFYVHFCTPRLGGSKRREKCSAMYKNVHFCRFTYISRTSRRRTGHTRYTSNPYPHPIRRLRPSPFHNQFHFTLFLLLLSVPRCHSSEHFAMDLATFQHILVQRGLETIAERACQHHADKWTALFRTGDHEKEFEQLIDLAMKVQTMRKLASLMGMR